MQKKLEAKRQQTAEFLLRQQGSNPDNLVFSIPGGDEQAKSAAIKRADDMAEQLMKEEAEAAAAATATAKPAKKKKSKK
jgi:hypothetical protein